MHGLALLRLVCCLASLLAGAQPPPMTPLQKLLTFGLEPPDQLVASYRIKDGAALMCNETCAEARRFPGRLLVKYPGDSR